MCPEKGNKAVKGLEHRAYGEWLSRAFGIKRLSSLFSCQLQQVCVVTFYPQFKNPTEVILHDNASGQAV